MLRDEERSQGSRIELRQAKLRGKKKIYGQMKEYEQNYA